MREDVTIHVSTHGHRTLASSGSAWEPVVGYSRAVRIGSTIAVTGTVGVESDGTFAATMEGQARRALVIILAAIEALGGKATDVIRTRIYTTDISKWQEIGAAHAEIFASIRPATTMVEVPRLIDDAALIEIEADAVIS
jgi:enamine deaminase RidA (YjgF/YER057c/UK114 family)